MSVLPERARSVFFWPLRAPIKKTPSKKKNPLRFLKRLLPGFISSIDFFPPFLSNPFTVSPSMLRLFFFNQSWPFSHQTTLTIFFNFQFFWSVFFRLLFEFFPRIFVLCGPHIYSYRTSTRFDKFVLAPPASANTRTEHAKLREPHLSPSIYLKHSTAQHSAISPGQSSEVCTAVRADQSATTRNEQAGRVAESSKYVLSSIICRAVFSKYAKHAFLYCTVSTCMKLLALASRQFAPKTKIMDRLLASFTSRCILPCERA